MTVRNRSLGWLVMACASCCWLSPLPPEWVARVYGLDTTGETSVDAAADVTDLVAAGRSPADLPQIGRSPAGRSPADSGRSRARTGRRWGPWRTPRTADL